MVFTDKKDYYKSPCCISLLLPPRPRDKTDRVVYRYQRLELRSIYAASLRLHALHSHFIVHSICPAPRYQLTGRIRTRILPPRCSLIYKERLSSSQAWDSRSCIFGQLIARISLRSCPGTWRFLQLPLPECRLAPVRSG